MGDRLPTPRKPIFPTGCSHLSRPVILTDPLNRPQRTVAATRATPVKGGKILGTLASLRTGLLWGHNQIWP